MLRRPNRASWHEESAGRPSSLAQLLASPQPLHAFHPNNGFVGARQNLPGQIGFGSLQQHPVSGTAFTGGRVANPQTGLVHSPQMPSFSQANEAGSHAGSGVAASLAALGLLVGTPHGGGATPTLPTGPGTDTTPTVAAVAPPAQSTLTTGVQPPPPTNPEWLNRPTGMAVRPDATGAAPTNPEWFNRPTGTTVRPNPMGLAELLTSIGRRGVYNV